MPALRNAEYLVQRVRELLMRFEAEPFRSGFASDPYPSRYNYNLSILANINAILAMVSEAGAYQTVKSYDSTSGTAAYTLDRDVLDIKTVRWNNTRIEFVEGGERQLEEDHPDYGTSSETAGTPTLWTTRGTTTIILYPKPNVTTVGIIKVLCATAMPDLVATTDSPVALTWTQLEDLPVLAAYRIAVSNPDQEGMDQRAAALEGLAAMAARNLRIEAAFRQLHQLRAVQTTVSPSAPPDPLTGETGDYK